MQSSSENDNLRASAHDQDASRAQQRLKAFALEHNHRVAGWYVENASGASLQRPELMRLLSDAEKGDLILIEQVDRLSRLDDEGWQQLKRMMQEKNLAIISLDLPTSYAALMPHGSDEFTRSMLTAINSMMLDMLAAIARKDYTDRRRRQQEGVKKAKQKGVYRGRMPDQNKHDLIRSLRHQGKSISETARLAGVSERTVTRVSKS
ncbi:recombinase family protein [Klebsiella pneumoniae]|nr:MULTISPECIES: recombinase family protein [Enterobacteriaceae]MDC8539282.1 recombinase family protein [Klebsiella pneumoniae]